MFLEDIFNLEDLVSVKTYSNNDDEKFLIGNSEMNSYIPFKHYKPVRIIPKSQEEALLIEIMKYAFLVNDANLCLDLINDKIKYEQFKEYIKKYNEACSKYTSMYGPLELMNDSYSNYKWNKTGFPLTLNEEGGRHV